MYKIKYKIKKKKKDIQTYKAEISRKKKYSFQRFKSARIQISSQKTRGGQTQKLPIAAC